MITPAADNPNRLKNEAAPSPVGLKNVPATQQAISLQLQGEVPKWVNGIMYRSGAGRYNILLDNGDTHHISHPFDGLAMLHRFEINGETQTVKYSSRHTSHGVERRIGERDPTLLTFGPDPCKTIFGRMQTVYHHISRFGSNAKLQENDPEFDMVNVTITPNFPLGERLEAETGIPRGQALVIKRDANTLQVVDNTTLEPIKMFTYGHISDKLQGQLCASHHQYDEETDEYVNFMVKLGPFPSFQLFILGPYLPNPSQPPPEPRLCEPIWRHLGAWKTMQPLKPAYIHSFSLTKNYIIIPNFPYYYSFGGLSAIYYSCAYQTFYWDETRPTLFQVVDRHTGRHIATYDADPCFAFHSANAWDEEIKLPGGGTEHVIYMDYCTYENTDIVDASFELGKLSSGDIDLAQVAPAKFVIKKHTRDKKNHAIAPSQVRRYRLGHVPSPSSSKRWTPDAWSFGLEYNKRRVASYSVLGYDLELPRFNPRYNLRPYRYLWGVCESRHAPSYASGAVVNGLIKLDLNRPYEGKNTDEKSSAKIWDEPGSSCSEPIFVPNPEGTAEDDGVILSTVNTIDQDKQESHYLLILDAATMAELGRTTLGTFHATTIHGSFVDIHGKGVAVN
ncbi:putative carotene oxygenase [Radiomyces spectabilis]|uniref:putative carotene oxygenase n=1 Tax=Radiomyces spectabilis TaxID=64574 RepID=UPI00222114AA|nr:putative carotene oxygenase [Radiomyces spectabilis]KAI8376534.1 putative carotene oxygenase [Radiomyces spectabilis]